MGIRIVGSSLLVSFMITLVSVGVWNIAVVLAALIGNSHSPEDIACVRYTFFGVFIGTYVLSFAWQVWQAMRSADAE